MFRLFIGLLFLGIFLTSCSVREASSAPKKAKIEQKSKVGEDLYPINSNSMEDMSPGLKNDTVDVGSGLDAVDLMDSTEKKKYNSLKAKEAKLDQQIDTLERERRAIMMQQIKPIGGFGIGYGPTGSANGLSIARTNSGNDLTIDGDRNIDRLKWQSESVRNQLKSLKTERDFIESDINKLKAESTKTCFPKSVKILLADGSNKEISKIKKDDLVMVYDVGKDEISASKVKKVYISDNNHMYIINSSINATAYERFLTEDHGWMKIRDLKVGDRVFDGNSYEKIVRIDKILKKQKVYNLNILSKHNFFVSSNGNKYFLIHNCSGGGK